MAAPPSAAPTPRVHDPRLLLQGVGALAAHPQSVDVALRGLHELLGAQVTWVGRLQDGQYSFEHIEGDGESFSFGLDKTLDENETYCRRVIDQRVPPIIPDTSREPEVASLAATRVSAIGSYLSVPLTFSDGQVYGALCAANHHVDPTLSERDLELLRIFGRMIADQIELEEISRRAHRSELHSTALAMVVASLAGAGPDHADRCQRTIDRAVAVAEQVGLSERELEDVRHVALLHDIDGDTLSGIPGFDRLAPMVQAAHQPWHGDSELPMASRIVFVCDAYETLTTREDADEDDARATLESGAGSRFCPAATLALLTVLERG